MTAEALELLRKSAMERYAWRAQVEWKLCLALWTSMAAFTGSVVTGKVVIRPGEPVQLGVIILALLIFLLHWGWLHGLHKAQHLDNEIAFFFRNRMMECVGVHFTPEIAAEIDRVKKDNKGVISHWSHGFQLGITLLLAVGASLAVAWAYHLPQK
jgi:hypothetical protein